MATFLTRRQRQVLDFLIEFQRSEGVMPTHREIRKRFGYSSYGTVHKHLALLEQKGYLRRQRHQKRGVELVEPEDRSRTESVSSSDLPLFELSADGTEWVSLSRWVAVDRSLLGGRQSPHVLLRVDPALRAAASTNDSWIDGDLLIVERRDLAAEQAGVDRAASAASPSVSGPVGARTEDDGWARLRLDGKLTIQRPESAAPSTAGGELRRNFGVVVGLIRTF